MEEFIKSVHNGRCGAYILTNVVTGLVYVGSTSDLYHRKMNHESELRRNVHVNPGLQAAYNAYPWITFHVVVTADRESAYAAEEQLMRQYASSGLLTNIAMDISATKLAKARSVSICGAVYPHVQAAADAVKLPYGIVYNRIRSESSCWADWMWVD